MGDGGGCLRAHTVTPARPPACQPTPAPAPAPAPVPHLQDAAGRRRLLCGPWRGAGGGAGQQRAQPVGVGDRQAGGRWGSSQAAVRSRAQGGNDGSGVPRWVCGWWAAGWWGWWSRLAGESWCRALPGARGAALPASLTPLHQHATPAGPPAHIPAPPTPPPPSAAAAAEVDSDDSDAGEDDAAIEARREWEEAERRRLEPPRLVLLRTQTNQ